MRLSCNLLVAFASEVALKTTHMTIRRCVAGFSTFHASYFLISRSVSLTSSLINAHILTGSLQSLVVLDYLLHSGSENVILYCEDNIYVIKTLREFQYIDDYGRDQGANVRQKAKDITNLLLDRRRLGQERTARARMRDRMLGRPSTDTDDEDEDGIAPYRRPVGRPRGQNGDARERENEEEENLRKAIEESKKSANALATAEDRDVQRAIELSKEEEERRKRLVALAERWIFDDTDLA